MSMQSRYSITFGSGDQGIATEKKLRLAADKEGKDFSVWIKEALSARADEVLRGSESQKKVA